MNRLERVKEIQASIAQVLMQEWDPINIRNEPACVGEYDSYVGSVYRLLASRAGVLEIATHLAHLEHAELGFPNTKAEQLLPVATTLRALDVTLGARADSE